MSDVKSVIGLLCKHLLLSIGSSLKPEYFRLAKYNKADIEANETFWSTLHTLSRLAVKYVRTDINFDNYDDLRATKLYLAFLQYPTTEFYALSAKDKHGSRELLLALGWLLVTKNPLNLAIRAKIASSAFGHEFSCVEDFPEGMECNELPKEILSQTRSIVYGCGRINHNIKAISELVNEKIKLTTKIHGASLNVSGLPHLSVYEVALTKKLCVKDGVGLTRKDESSIRELHDIATLLDTHAKWTKREHVFYDWMVTVIEESKNEARNAMSDERLSELSSFVSLLRHEAKKKLHSLKSNVEKIRETSKNDEPCISRFLRTQQEGTEAQSWSLRTIEHLNIIEKNLETKTNELTSELRKMLKSIPNCVEI